MDQIVDASNEQERLCAGSATTTCFAPLDRRRGLPIGTLTSSVCNWYLTPLTTR